MSVLVAYATSQGSTGEIAERIASRLPPSLGTVDCCSIEKVSSLNSYTAVIIGSAVHGGKWLPSASNFVENYANSLSNRHVWAFSVGMVDALPGWLRYRGRQQEEKKIASDVRRHVQIRDHKLFSGVSQKSDMSKWMRYCWSCLGGRFGDLRDWAEVDRWCEMIAEELKHTNS